MVAEGRDPPTRSPVSGSGSPMQASPETERRGLPPELQDGPHQPRLICPSGVASLPRSASGNSWLLPTSMKQQEIAGCSNPPVVRQALVAAAARITTPDSFTNPRQLIRVDGAPVIIHLLRGLQTSGIQRAVITLGHAAHLLAEEVRKHSFGAMVVEFVWCEASSWKRGHASNILAARSMFPTVCVHLHTRQNTQLHHHATSLPLTHHHPTPVACNAGRAAPHGHVRPHL